MCVNFEVSDHHPYLIAQKVGFGLTLIMTLITMYLVIEYSSVQMKGYKNILLFHLICFLFHDFVMGVASSGRTFAKVSGFRQMGLLADIGFPIKYTLLIGGCLTTEIIGIYVDMFVYRTQVIIPKKHVFSLRENNRRALSAFFYSAWITGLIFTTVCFSDDFDDIYLQLKENDICESDYHYLLFTENALVVLESRRWIMLVLLILGISLFFVIVAICFGLSLYYINSSHSTLSKRTKMLQKSLLFSLLIQTIVPSIMMILPSVVLLYSPSLIINKICFIFYAQHGNMNSIVLVLAHYDYRRALLKPFHKFFGGVANRIYLVKSKGKWLPLSSCWNDSPSQTSTTTP